MNSQNSHTTCPSFLSTQSTLLKFSEPTMMIADGNLPSCLNLSCLPVGTYSFSCSKSEVQMIGSSLYEKLIIKITQPSHLAAEMEGSNDKKSATEDIIISRQHTCAPTLEFTYISIFIYKHETQQC